MKHLILLALLLAATTAHGSEADALREKATHIEREAQQAYLDAIATAQQLRADADLLDQHADKLTPEAKAEIKERADEAKADLEIIKDAEFDALAKRALEERRAMKARGENVEVPKDVAAMKAILKAEEAESEERDGHR
jgi:hypothetical protein